MTLLDVLPGAANGSLPQRGLIDTEFARHLCDVPAAVSMGTSSTNYVSSEFAVRSVFTQSDTVAFPHVLKILGLGSNFEMAGIDANRSVTDMSYDKAVWNRTVRDLIGCPVSGCGCNPIFCGQRTVSGCLSSFRPVPTFVGSGDVNPSPEEVEPGHTLRSMSLLEWDEWITVTPEPVVVATAHGPCVHLAPAVRDGTDTIGHGANSLIVESCAPGSFARPGGTPSLARRVA